MCAVFCDYALSVLNAAAPNEKVAAAITAHKAFKTIASPPIGEQKFANCELPHRPARPARPELRPPSEVPKRNPGSEKGRISLIHALAHIELNAIDLAFDMAARFAPEIQDSGLNGQMFVSDWVAVGADEARHFIWLERRLSALGSYYGALPAHDGFWDAATKTADCALARLAVAPMVLEARGLDVTPDMAERLRNVGDPETAAILEQIFIEEQAHVGAGIRWFEAICEVRNLDSTAEFRRLVNERFNGPLKPPFNEKARYKAGMRPEYYRDWNDFCGQTHEKSGS